MEVTMEMDGNGQQWRWMTMDNDGDGRQWRRWMAMEMAMDEWTEINDD